MINVAHQGTICGCDKPINTPKKRMEQLTVLQDEGIRGLQRVSHSVYIYIYIYICVCASLPKQRLAKWQLGNSFPLPQDGGAVIPRKLASFHPRHCRLFV